MPSNEIQRMKEIIAHYRNAKKKVHNKPLDAAHRQLLQRLKHEALEELETLIARL